VPPDPPLSTGPILHRVTDGDLAVGGWQGCTGLATADRHVILGDISDHTRLCSSGRGSRPRWSGLCQYRSHPVHRRARRRPGDTQRLAGPAVGCGGDGAAVREAGPRWQFRQRPRGRLSVAAQGPRRPWDPDLAAVVAHAEPKPWPGRSRGGNNLEPADPTAERVQSARAQSVFFGFFGGFGSEGSSGMGSTPPGESTGRSRRWVAK
jgi:hypothetical protein